jgi:hypothetical protein
MIMQQHVSRILWYEGIGFFVIIALSWINELTVLPYLVGVRQYVSNWHESALETLIVLVVAIPVMIFTRRLVSRLYYLEAYLRVCSWCKKLEHNGEWVALEEFFEQKFETLTSHAMCPACTEGINKTIKKRVPA